MTTVSMDAGAHGRLPVGIPLQRAVSRPVTCQRPSSTADLVSLGAILDSDKDKMTLRNYGDKRGPAGHRANHRTPDTKQAAWARWG
ncbi:hypothetical protein OPT61_g4131 [Boeremia exigua]|uniref:Uncharacterized protein n=1 Tax=Boeremia exigua TaxID=749465 RepID=A0ACC2IF93_9PLEO|nr:hypothetical protein OPT61_g4131 [Boeremia exigua]